MERDTNDAKNYQLLSHRVQGKFLDVLIESLNLKKGDICIDLGCGTGSGSILLSEKVGNEGKVLAIDPDSARIKQAKEHNARRNIEYIEGKVTDVEIATESIDAVSSSFVVHWLTNEEKRETFRRLNCLMKKGSTFVFSTAGTTPEIVKNIVELIPKDSQNDFMNVTYYEKESFYRDLAKELGFVVVAVHYVEKNFVFASCDEFVNWAEATFHIEFSETFFGNKEKFLIDEKNQVHEAGVAVLYVFKKI